MHSLIVSIVAVGTTGALGQTLLGPVEYLQSSDSPFIGEEGLFIEDFMDLSLDPRISASYGVILNSGLSVDSADIDDGEIDGNGNVGASFYSDKGAEGVRFEFNADVIGAAPTAAGVVWTDGAGVTTFEAYGTDGQLLGTVSASHAGVGAFGQTDEDRFYGVRYEEGIGSIVIRNSAGGIEVDHVQFVAIPAPGTLALAGLGGLVANRRRR